MLINDLLKLADTFQEKSIYFQDVGRKGTESNDGPYMSPRGVTAPSRFLIYIYIYIYIY